MTNYHKEQISMITELALKDLTVSPMNVRKTSADKDIVELAQSIQARGLIQNLTAFASKGGKKYEVVAGGRRLQALQLLARNKEINPSTYMVRVNLIESTDATDISLTENAMRSDLHPADQFEAFKKLVDDGQSIEAVAANFGVTPAVVNRRLRMANAAPEVIEAFKLGDIELDKVMALCTSNDHRIQKAILKKSWWSASAIRSEINKESNGIDADDRLVKFIGLEAYTAAGGQVIEDLFASEFDDGSGKTLTNHVLVENLAEEKLCNLTSEAFKKSKLAWHKPDINTSYLGYNEYEKFSAKDAKKINGQFLGVVGIIARDGTPEVTKYVAKRCDVNKIKKLLNGVGDSSSEGGSITNTTALLTSGATNAITQVRTKALQCAIAADADKALKMLVCEMITANYAFGSSACFGLSMRRNLITTEIASLEALQDQQFNDCGLNALMDDGDLKDDLEGLVDLMKTPQLLRILAFLTASMVDVTQSAYSLDTESHRKFSDLGRKFKLNMSNHFKPDQSNYFEHMPKSALVNILGDESLANKKKCMLALLANDKVEAMWSKGRRWVPEILRIHQDDESQQAPTWPFPGKVEA